MEDGSSFSLISLFWCGDLAIGWHGYQQFWCLLGGWWQFCGGVRTLASVNGFSWVSLWRRKGLVFKELFLFLLIFFASKNYMGEISLLLRLFLLIFLAFLFDFLGYQTQSSKIITFFVNYFFEEKRTKKKKKKTLPCCWF